MQAAALADATPSASTSALPLHVKRPLPSTSGSAESLGIVIKPASLADAYAVSSIFIETFRTDKMFDWLYQWPALGSPLRSSAEKNIVNLHLPAIKRFLSSPGAYFFIAYDKATGERVGMSSWEAPSTASAVHWRQNRTYLERIQQILYYIYDSVSAVVYPSFLQQWLDPITAGLHARSKRWAAFRTQQKQAGLDSSHLDQGYWKLSSLGVTKAYEGRGIGKKLLEWGLEQADREDRAVYLGASAPGVPVYRKVGFEVVDRRICAVGEVKGDFESVQMCRQRKSMRENNEAKTS